MSSPRVSISVGFSPTSEENCELSDKNSYDLDIDNPSFYDNSERHDFYQRESRALDYLDSGTGAGACLDGESQPQDYSGSNFSGSRAIVITVSSLIVRNGT